MPSCSGMFTFHQPSCRPSLSLPLFAACPPIRMLQDLLNDLFDRLSLHMPFLLYRSMHPY